MSDKQLYIIMFRTPGMSGGTARGVYNMLCSTPEWKHQHSQGVLSFYASNIKVCDIYWRTDYETPEDISSIVESQKSACGDRFEIFMISGEDALKIDKGEPVLDSCGYISPSIVDLIFTQGDKSQTLRKEFNDLDLEQDD